MGKLTVKISLNYQAICLVAIYIFKKQSALFWSLLNVFQTNGIDKTKHSFNEFTNYQGITLVLEG